MKLRLSKGGYDESMATTVEIEPTITALRQAILNFGVLDLPNPLTPEMITVDYYDFDPRNNWETHIVFINGWGVFGYTDGSLNDC